MRFYTEETSLAIYYAERHFSDDHNPQGMRQLARRQILPGLMRLERKLAKEIANFSLDNYSYVLWYVPGPKYGAYRFLFATYSADQREETDERSKVLVVRGYDFFDRHAFVCWIYDKTAEEAFGYRSLCKVYEGEGAWKRWNADAVRIWCVLSFCKDLVCAEILRSGTSDCSAPAEILKD